VEDSPEPAAATPVATAIRPIVRDEPTQAIPTPATRSSSVRTFVAEASAKVHVIAPTEFGDARLIAERLMSNQPVIVNLQVADVQLMRRMIDFCSGVTFALSGKMERVADRVFLMTPSNVKVSAEERQRLQENGLLRP
jgi:cell division inhibitor SepF